MIPDFKTYLKESVWMDIHKRSTGEVDRKEEDINLLDMYGFYKYLCDRYEKANDYMSHTDYIDKLENGKSISIMMFEDTNHSRVYRVVIWNFDKIPYITIGRNPETTNSNYFKKISGKYKMIESGDERWNPLYTIEPKDGSEGGNNRFFLEVIDFLLDNIEPPFEPYIRRKVNESVWMDIHKHSTGDTERKEESIDLLDGNDFYEYLKDLYISKNPDRDIIGGPFMDDIMTMPFLDEENMLEYNLEIVYKPGRHEIQFVTIPDHSTVNYDDLEDTFELGLADDERRVGLYPKDGSGLTNTFVITVIDYLLDHSKKYAPKFTKRDDDFVDESVWVNIHKRSNNEIERKEDELVNKWSRDELLKYLRSIYKFKHAHDFSPDPRFRSAFSTPIILKDGLHSVRYDLNTDVPRYDPIILFYEGFNRKFPDVMDWLKENFKVDTIGYISVGPKDGSKVNNQFFIEFLDQFTDYLEKSRYDNIISKK